MQHNWPGNVRELTHALERAYLIGSGHITADLLENEMAGIAAPAGQGAGGGRAEPAGDFQAAMDQTERDLLERALRTAGGNKTAAAAALGMKASTFRDKLSQARAGLKGRSGNPRRLAEGAVRISGLLVVGRFLLFSRLFVVSGLLIAGGLLVGGRLLVVS